jgi:hypothetical protein
LLPNLPTRRSRGAPGAPVLSIDPYSGSRRLARVGSAAWQGTRTNASWCAPVAKSPKGQIPPHGTCGATAEVQYDPSHIQPEHGDWRARRNSNARARQWPPHWVPYQLLRRLFALRGRRSFGRSRAASGQNPPGTDSNPNSLGPQPLPGRPGPERGPCIPGPTPRSTPTKIRDLLVFGALTYRGDCGWIECPNQLVGWGQPPGGARKSLRGR